MAAKYWKGGGTNSNINSSPVTNWSDTDGGANNAANPGSGDFVFYTANSVGPSVWNVSTAWQGVDTTGYTGLITHNTAVTLTINTAAVNSLLFSAGMTYTANSATASITFTHTSGTADITSNGKRFGGILINGAGGTTRLLDALRVDLFTTSALGITTGAFDGNGFGVTINGLNSSNANVRSLILGGGTWSVGGGAAAASTPWNVGTVTNLTFTKGASNIVFPSNGLGSYRIFASGSQTFNDLTIDSNSARGMFFLTGNPTFANLAVGPGNVIALPTGTTTISNPPTWTGTASLPILVECNTPGSAATISCPSGTFTLSNAGIRDIMAIGGAAYVADNTYDFGNNTNWAISPPLTTVGDIANAVWQKDLTSGFGVGTAGSLVAQIEDLATTTNHTDGIVDTALTGDIYDDLTLEQAIQVILAAVAGKSSGLGTGTSVYRSITDDRNAIVSTDDTAGNRFNVILAP